MASDQPESDSIEVPDGDPAVDSSSTRDITALFLNFFENQVVPKDLEPEIIAALNEAVLEYLRTPHYFQSMNGIRVLYMAQNGDRVIKFTDVRSVTSRVRNTESYVTEEYLTYDEDDFL